MTGDVHARSWTHKDNDSEFLVSTEKSLQDLKFIESMFALEQVYWCNPCSARSVELLVANSCCFGLYVREAQGLRQVGLARLVTDYATFAYLTDVFVTDQFKGRGLGKWLIRCTDEVVNEIEDLRRYLLFTGKGSRTIPFYEAFGLSATSIDEDGLVVMVKKGPGAAAIPKPH